MLTIPNYYSRYFTNLKAANVLLFSRGAHGGVNVKLSDFFCFSVRSKDELSATLTEKFDQVPEMKDLVDALDVNQWNIIDAEIYVAGQCNFCHRNCFVSAYTLILVLSPFFSDDIASTT